MRLKSFGCSFIYGTELADCSDSASQRTWPALLAQNLNYDYKCYAQGGSGNLQISERVLNEASISDSSDLFVISWTWIDRFDYCSGLHDHWKTIRPSDTDSVSRNYYKDLHSEYRDKLTTLMAIRLVIDTLEQKNIKFVMTYMDELVFDQRWHITPAVKNLQTYTRPYMTAFDKQTFLNWSRKHGHPETAAWHPLEEAHRAAADYMVKIVGAEKTD